MHRRLLILCLSLVAVFGVATPTSAAGSFTATIVSPVCRTSGGQYGHGKLNATAHFEENGGTSTNYFRSIAQIQRKNGSSWVAYNPKAKYKSNVFVATNAGHSFNLTWKYAFMAAEIGPTYRVRLIFEFWRKQAGADHRLASYTRYGPTCNT
jgi:hypothetical protein